MTTIDQGFLSMLNSSLPNCPSNNEFATFASPYVKSVAKGAPCDVGYTKDNPLTKGGIISSDVYDLCASRALVPPPTDLQIRMTACAESRGPDPSLAPAPSPAPAEPKKIPSWALPLILAVVLILVVGGFGYSMTRNKPV